ncbi:helix-turn-helix transcriptional regulator [Streptomyces sp. NPDC051173]|uniref:helix-turn-helix domain-containing protein n=1 Tax=Streptomyces sp. NPDC051173 TaxID=3155164 RepID=UPI00344E94FA
MERPPATFEVNGAALRRTRMHHGIGIHELADSAGISRSYLQRLETGTRRRMRPGTYAALRTALNVDDDRLLNEEPTEKR